MLLTKLQRRKSRKLATRNSKKNAISSVSRIAELLAGHSKQTINKRLSISEDVYLMIFNSIWIEVATMLGPEAGEELTVVEAQELAETLNNRLASEEFHNYALARVDTVRRSYQRSKAKLVKQLSRLKQDYSKLMLVRVDLHYGKDYSKHMEPERRVLHDWRRLREIIAKQFTASYLGYYAKLEYGIDRSVHLHVLFLFDGRVVRQDETIGRKICSIWTDEVTDGVGTAYNVNNPAKKAAYKNCGVGVFRHLDGATIAGFQAVADYLTKPDFMTRLTMPWQRRRIFSYFVRPHLLSPRPLSSATVSINVAPSAG